MAGGLWGRSLGPREEGAAGSGRAELEGCPPGGDRTAGASRCCGRPAGGRGREATRHVLLSPPATHRPRPAPGDSGGVLGAAPDRTGRRDSLARSAWWKMPSGPEATRAALFPSQMSTEDPEQHPHPLSHGVQDDCFEVFDRKRTMFQCLPICKLDSLSLFSLFFFFLPLSHEAFLDIVLIMGYHCCPSLQPTHCLRNPMLIKLVFCSQILLKEDFNLIKNLIFFLKK